MFILVTAITLLLLSVFQPEHFEHIMSAQTLSSFAIFWFPTWQTGIFYALWGLAFINSVIPPERRLAVFQFIARFGALGNMQILEILLLLASLLLLAEGWFRGTTIWFVAGFLLLIGLLGNILEQRSF